MPRHWNWDFEDEQRARRRRAPQAEPAPVVVPERARATQIRRRRGGAALVLVALVAVLAAALSGSAHQHAASAARTRAQVARAVPPSDSENDERAAVKSVLAYTPFVKAAGTRGNDVALTFDDGPGPYTPEVLSVLERFHVRATFFAIGKMLRYFGASTVREIEDRDAIGDHT
ncbi:MAG TPA: polysaccharide deacetylase family protein, partial [Solirubrobacteraceae bacterium]|nr:polysaccharide deacetylase family protein [Solirubrobacteraceae bacterium]